MHKLLFDQNLSYRIIKQIETLFPNSTHVRLIKLDNAEDFMIWQFAKEHNYHIITKDSDFNDISNLHGYPPKIIQLNLGNTSTQTIIKLLQEKNEIIVEFLNNDTMGLLKLD